MYNRKLLVFFISLLYAYLLIELIPIDSIKDRENYLNYASWPEILIIQRLQRGVLDLIFNDPIFLLINFLLSFLLDKENVVRCIIFFGSFATSYMVLKYNYRYFIILLLFLLFPPVLKNYVIHLRQGLAISFFLIGYLSTSNRQFKNSFFIFLSPLIHSSFFVLLLLIYLNKCLNKFKFDIALKILVIVLCGIISSFVMETAGQLVGARQVNEHEFTSDDISGLGFLFWLVILFLYVLQGKYYLKNNFLSIAVLLFYLTTYFFIPVTARIFESGIVLVLLSSLDLTGWRRYSFIGLIFFYSLFMVFTRIAYPYFGWGVI